MTAQSERNPFFIASKDFEPVYRALYRTGELQARAEQAIQLLEHCQVCPHVCGVNRLADKFGTCRIGRYAHVASYGAHLGEEDCLRGWCGSGTIFFASCNLRCVFCQNADISHRSVGIETSPEQLAAIMLELQTQGCHNINLVTPEHVVPQILEALPIAVEGGLNLPLVYNTSAYSSVKTLRLLDGVVDIYMPDFKFWEKVPAGRYLRAENYPVVARVALKEMQRQVGDLKLDENQLAKRGILLRHLVMPGYLNDTRQIMRWLAEEISPHLYINVMSQYYPAGQVSNTSYKEINRCLTSAEYAKAVKMARKAGLTRFNKRHVLLH